MDTSSPSSQASRSTRRVWPTFVGIMLFAALMALRYELSSVWARAAAAAGAFVVLGLSVVVSRRPRA